MTLTHSSTTLWADAATDEPKHGGLTRFGEEVVREMNRLGMMVDISHVSDGTMDDVLRISEAPVIFSHSSARALADHRRNVPDSILTRLAKNGGVVMVNFYPGFINATAAKQAANVLDKEREFKAMYPNDPDKSAKAFTDYLSTFKTETGTLEEVADHIDYIRKVAGIDHVGIGADFGSLTQHSDGTRRCVSVPVSHRRADSPWVYGSRGEEGPGAQHPPRDAGGGGSSCANPAHARPVHRDDGGVALVSS